MLSRTVAVRTIRLEAKASDDKDAKAGLARDRVLSMFNMQRQNEVDQQRKGLSLASLFGAKPRPMWSAPALVATFGDCFIEGTMFEGSSCLAWSFQVIDLIFQRMLGDQDSLFEAPAALPTRMALGDVAHVFAKSAPVFKEMARLLRTPNNAQLMSFLRKLHNHIAAVPEGEMILLPSIIQGSEILLLLERNTERSYTLTVINTDPLAGLSHHAVSPAVKPNRLMYRTCLVLSGIQKKNALDDVFWMAVYNLSLSENEGDMDRFYEVLLPFITGKPLEVSLVEAEEAAANASEPTACSYHASAGAFGPWRTPQRAQTQYVRALYHAINFILTRRRGVSALRCKQVGLALRLQMVSMIRNDLNYMQPDDNGTKVCLMAFRQLSYRAVKIAEALEASTEADHDIAIGSSAHQKDSICSICLEGMEEDATSVVNLPCTHSFHRDCLDELVNSGSKNCPLCRKDLAGAGSVEEMIDKVRSLVEDCQAELVYCLSDQHPLPTPLDLHARDDAWVGNAMAYDVEYCDPNPGQVVALQSFVPMDMLQIPERVETRAEAVSTLRRCDALCTLLDNQGHNVKNTKHLILSLIQHVFVQVVPIPKPRKDPRAEKAELSYVAGRSGRRREKEQLKQRDIAAKREEMRAAKGAATIKTPKKLNGGASEPSVAEDAEEKMNPEEIDTSPGASAIHAVCAEACIWDEGISYHLQVEMLLVLQRLMEHFAAAVLSLQASRPLDAVRVIVPGCICAISDAIMRHRAYDSPSVACAQLMGLDATGRQLGFHGFGIGVGVFATQTETIEVHSPELVVARAAILDYFDSPLQRKLDKIFHWDEQFVLAPGRNLIKYLRMIAREIAMQNANPHIWMCDDVPEASKILHNFPELRAYRDVTFYWKYFLNPCVKAFPNFSDAQELSRMHTILCFHWSEEENGYRVENSLQRMFCRPNPNEIDPQTRRPFKADELPKHRFPSTATPSFFAPPPAIKTEDDIIYRANLPSFETVCKKGVPGAPAHLGPSAHLVTSALGQRDSELLLSFLTVPYLRLPLVLNFFATDDRVHKLSLPKLRDILDSVVFEPGRHLNMSMTNVEPVIVPTQHKELLASAHGALLNELFQSPESVIRSILSIMDSVLAIDTGSVCDSKNSDFNTSVEIILYVTRLSARVHHYLHFAVTHARKIRDTASLGMHEDAPDTLSALEDALLQVTNRLIGPFSELLDDYLTRLDEETTATPEDEGLINRNSRLASDLHAHKLLCFRNCEAGSMGELMSSFIYLTTRHTWNKNRREVGRLLVPEFELYELYTLQRRRLVTNLVDMPQLRLDSVMEKALQTATSTTGAWCKKIEASVSNEWGKHTKHAGCFVLVGSRAASDRQQSTKTKTTKSVNTDDSEHEGLKGVEMDLQLGQMTLRAKHLAALDSEVANKPQVREVFGESTMQASLLERAEHRKRFKLIGVHAEIDYWPEGHQACPALSDRWERDYDPAELHPSEAWIPPLFEPVRKAFFDGPNPPALQFMMVPGPLPESADVAVLVGLHPHIGGAFKLVYIFRAYRCVQVYECVSHARQHWYVLHLSTDCRFALRHLQPETRSLVHPLPAWWQRGGGEPYPRGVSSRLCSNLSDSDPLDSFGSCSIIRDTQHSENLSGSRETFVPTCLLLGLIPEALLESHCFWQDQTRVPGNTNYRRLRGYPRESEAVDYMLAVDLFVKTTGTNAVTGIPELSTRVEKKNYETAKRNFQLFKSIAARIELLQLASQPSTTHAQPKRVVKKQLARFSIDDPVETLASDLIAGLQDTTWVPCKVVGCETSAPHTYDLQFASEWAWLGVRTVHVGSIRTRMQEKEIGRGIWRFDNMSDSEDEAVRSGASDDASDDEDALSQAREASRRKTQWSLSLHQFSQLVVVLEAAGWSAQGCEEALDQIATNRIPRDGNLETFYDMAKLAEAVREQCKHASKPSSEAGSAGNDTRNEERMVMVDLMFVKRQSRLFALVQALSRIENLSHIVAWTRQMEPTAGDVLVLDIVDLPRLKLTFGMRSDFEGKMRLFSLDHADLYVSNDVTAVSGLMEGIPHSVLLRNASRGESQLLVPVLPPVRPTIVTQPFTTELVIDRSDVAWVAALSQRFFLYPIHVSSSFIVTKGLNSALYLLLLRLLHRDYQKAFRMADSIATDAKFSQEGAKIFHALRFANNDPHPDAHSCRLKVALVTMGCGETMPWDLTRELAAYIQKVSHVSATCRISLEEELQLLSSSHVVLDDQSPTFNPDTYDPYLLVLLKNRLHYLRAQASVASLGLPLNTVEVKCFAPPRAMTDGWPWYQDNTVFGEEYNQSIEIQCAEQWQTFLENGSHQKLASPHIRHELAPPGGWLTVVMVHVLWSTQSIKLMPRYAELVPMHPYVTFLSLKGDLRGLCKMVKELQVDTFPTLLLMRGEKEIEGTRITGQDRQLERLLRVLGEHVTEYDRSAHVHLLTRMREEAGVESDQDEPDNEEQMIWVFDVECCGPDIAVSEQGLCAEHAEDTEDVHETAAWEYRNDANDDQGDGSGEWIAMPAGLVDELEKNYKRGVFYRQAGLYLSAPTRYSTGVDLEWSIRKLKLFNNCLTGLSGYWDNAEYQRFHLRRKGGRLHVKGEEKIITSEQQHLDLQMHAMREQRQLMQKIRRQEQKGKNSQAIRGTNTMGPNSGVHSWTLRWEHEPALAGIGDGVGLASLHSESGGPCAPPLIGGTYDQGSSVALYATGVLVHSGLTLATVVRKKPRALEVRSDLAAKTTTVQTNERKKTGRRAGKDYEEIEVEDEAEGEEEDSTEQGEEESKEEDEENAIQAFANGKGNTFSKQDDTLAPLWGKGSLITCTFDTEGAGTLKFEVDGEAVDVQVTSVFTLLGGDDLYPCVCFFPLDPDATEDGAVVLGQGSEESCDKDNEDEEYEEDEEESEYSEDENEEESDDDESVEQAPKSKKQADMEELAKTTKLDISIILAMTREQREELRKSIKAALDASRKARVTIVAPVLPVTEGPHPDGLQKEKTAPDNSVDQEKAEEANVLDEEDEDEKDKKTADDEKSQPVEKIRWMWEQQQTGKWETYSTEISRELELARRAGALEHTIRLGEICVLCKISGGQAETVQERGEETQRLRRHVVKDGIFGNIEMMSCLHKPPLSLFGEPCLQTLQRVWGSQETLSGHACGLGFLFIYSLLQGQTRSKVLSSGKAVRLVVLHVSNSCC